MITEPKITYHAAKPSFFRVRLQNQPAPCCPYQISCRETWALLDLGSGRAFDAESLILSRFLLMWPVCCSRTVQPARFLCRLGLFEQRPGRASSSDPENVAAMIVLNRRGFTAPSAFDIEAGGNSPVTWTLNGRFASGPVGVGPPERQPDELPIHDQRVPLPSALRAIRRCDELTSTTLRSVGRRLEPEVPLPPARIDFESPCPFPESFGRCA